jgi:GT2 family glycosyltransferase
MAEAERVALERNAGGWLLWLNDDVHLDRDAVTRLLTTSASHPRRIVVGSTRDSATGVTTYGGLVPSGRHPLALSLVQPPTDTAREVVTFNGNVVLVPLAVARALGGIDGAFRHAGADIDYGIRASRMSFAAVLAPGTFGTCSRNPEPPAESAWRAWRRFVSVKGGGHPPTAARLLRTAAPHTWLIWWSSTYLMWWLRRLGLRARPVARNSPR